MSAHKVNIGFCHACRDHLDAPASLLFLADVLLRMHASVCEGIESQDEPAEGEQP